MFLSYLRRHYKIIIMLAVFAAIFAGVFSLYELPTEAVGYSVALCLAAGAALFAVGYSRFRRKALTLRDMRESVLVSLDDLPAPSGAVEAEYQELLGVLFAARAAAESRAEEERRSAEDYYGLWAHQIKTPISAMRLMLQQSPSQENEALLSELFRVEQYVEMVLSYLRVGSESTDYVIRRLALDDVARGCIRKYARLFILKRISMDYVPTSLEVTSDAKWLAFVIEQVLSNALKYTPSGGSVRVYAQGSALGDRGQRHRRQGGGSAACVRQGLHRLQRTRGQEVHRHRALSLPARVRRSRPPHIHDERAGRGRVGVDRVFRQGETDGIERSLLLYTKNHGHCPWFKILLRYPRAPMGRRHLRFSLFFFNLYERAQVVCFAEVQVKVHCGFLLFRALRPFDQISKYSVYYVSGAIFERYAAPTRRSILSEIVPKEQLVFFWDQQPILWMPLNDAVMGISSEIILCDHKHADDMPLILRLSLGQSGKQTCGIGLHAPRNSRHSLGIPAQICSGRHLAGSEYLLNLITWNMKDDMGVFHNLKV